MYLEATTFSTDCAKNYEYQLVSSCCKRSNRQQSFWDTDIFMPIFRGDM